MTSTVQGGQVVKKEAVLEVERSRLEIRRNFFSTRAAREWNELPESVKKSTSVNGFKDSYDRWRYSNSNGGGADMKNGRHETDEKYPSPSQ